MTRKDARRTTNLVRDYMLELDVHVWVTSIEVYEDIKGACGKGPSSSKEVRRSLNWLVDQGLVQRDKSESYEMFRRKA